jgi:outer membrane immunogenic protein
MLVRESQAIQTNGRQLEMRIKVSLLLATLAILSLPALAQEGNSEVSANFTGNFQKQALGFGLTDTASDSAGLLANYRYHFNRWSGVEVNYSYTRYSQYYDSGSFTQATAQEASFAYLFTFGIPRESRFHPFAEAGAGALFFSPVTAGSNNTGVTSQNRAAFLYGVGATYRLRGNLSFQAGYRGLVFTAPDFTVSNQVTNARTQMAEPYAGLTFRF